ncbi:peptidylprolyl isomerase [Kurthia massiliensis]|uniref:peptidylprolyl isomerase n=1 Tax=Kurthia massiliensis TaxID=1033739 RepID=UPI00028969A3|nr:peptidylprolyl isomerase [Kurthia massiliensis]
MNIKKGILAATLATSVLALAACGDGGMDEKVVTSKVGDITVQNLYDEMKESAGSNAVQLIMIEKVLEDKYKVDDKAIKAKVDDQKKQIEEQGTDFKQYLASQGMTEDTFKRYAKLQLLQEAAQRDGIKVSDDEVKAYYDRLGKEVKASHILVADEKTAKKLKKQIDDGADFAKLAKKNSTDTSSAENGGELGWFGPDEMVGAFTDAAYDMKKGEISDPVKSDYGYHIIKVEDTRDKKVDGTLDEKKDEIKETLQLAKAKEEDPNQTKLQEKISKMMKDADIKIEDKDLKDALSSFLGSSSDDK